MTGPVSDGDKRVLRKLHQVIRKITEDFDSRWHFNTSIASMMELVNEIYACEADLTPGVLPQLLDSLVLLFGPFAPYVAQEMWETLGHEGPVFRQAWPAFDAELARQDLAEVVVQVNGKLRSKMSLPFGTTQNAALELANADPKVIPFVEGKTVAKVIFVPDKLVNIVVKG